MEMTRGALYAAFLSRDSRFDGRFFVGIKTTGIYCRPVCPARRAKESNCAFYPSQAAAEQAGYRPCLLCRPELAPGSFDPHSPAQRAARMLLDPEREGGLNAIAGELGYTPRHLRRLFQQAFGVSPVQYLQTGRLLLAKGLLTDTALSVTQAALAAGFGSPRRMNDLFQKHYRLSPSSLRGQTGQAAKSHTLLLNLPFRPPYPFQQMLGFLRGRAIQGVEMAEEGAYTRAVRLKARDGSLYTGWARVKDKSGENALQLEVSASLAPVLPQVLARFRRLLDLDADPEAISAVLEKMNGVKPGLHLPGVRLPGSFEPFETAARAVLGQQITVKAASTLAGRLVKELGSPLDLGQPGLRHTFPEPLDLLALGDSAQDRLGALGIIGTRAACILELARAFAEGTLSFSPGADPEKTARALLRIRGIGPWTANYLLMRVLGEPDAFLETDAGVKQALPGLSPKGLLALAEGWRPFRSYAVMNLWNSL